MRKSAPIHIVVHKPDSPNVQHELAKRVAEVHGDFVQRYIRNLDCPAGQKHAIGEAVIQAVNAESRSSPK